MTGLRIGRRFDTRYIETFSIDHFLGRVFSKRFFPSTRILLDRFFFDRNISPYFFFLSIYSRLMFFSF